MEELSNMKIYYAYEIYTNTEINMWVDTDCSVLLLHMAEDLKAADQDGLKRIIIGKVNGKDAHAALNAVRSSKWLEKGFADCTT